MEMKWREEAAAVRAAAIQQFVHAGAAEWVRRAFMQIVEN